MSCQTARADATPLQVAPGSGLCHSSTSRSIGQRILAGRNGAASAVMTHHLNLHNRESGLFVVLANYLWGSSLSMSCFHKQQWLNSKQEV